MKGYDKHYEAYMKAFGIPSLILAFIIGTPETLIITEPDENNNFYTLKKITGETLLIQGYKKYACIFYVLFFVVLIRISI